MHVPEHHDAETLYRLLEGRLEPPLEGAVESHLWRCEACRALRDECAATLGALRWYGEGGAAPPAGYWEGFWTRWPLAGEVRSPAAAAPRRGVTRRRLAPGLAAAAAVLLAVGLWWAAVGDRDAPERTAVSKPGAGPAAGARQLVVGTPWEGDYEAIERLTLALGSVDPLSKGVVLSSLAEEP